MSEPKESEDLFSPGMREAMKANQSEFIRTFKEMTNKLLVLQGQGEAEAIPEMIYIIDFMEKMLAQDDLNDVFRDLSDLSNYVMDQFFPELATMIFKIGLFPNPEVMGYTAKFLELHILLCVKAIKAGFPFFIRMVDHILTPGRNYYDNNNSKGDISIYPFGDGLCYDPGYTEFLGLLKQGDLVDVVKGTLSETKIIWSRAIVQDVKEYNVCVSFIGENQANLKTKFVKKAPFQLNRANTRSNDFEWRQSLKRGDFVDLYLARKGWLRLLIKDIKRQSDFKETYKFVEVIQDPSEEVRIDLLEDGEDLGSIDEFIRCHHKRARPPPAQTPLLQRPATRTVRILQRRDLRNLIADPRKPSLTNWWPSTAEGWKPPPSSPSHTILPNTTSSSSMCSL
jgi:hypothetical protein